MRIIRGFLTILHILVGIGAVVGGLALAALTVEGLWPGTWVADFLSSAGPRKAD